MQLDGKLAHDHYEMSAVTEYKKTASDTKYLKESLVEQGDIENGVATILKHNSNKISSEPSKGNDIGERTGPDCHMGMQNPIISNSTFVACNMIPTYSVRSSEVFLSKGGLDVCTDKRVTEFELPQLLVCFKDSNYLVKDICVDEGVPALDKVFIRSDVVEHVSLADLLYSDICEHGDVSKVLDSSDDSNELLDPGCPLNPEENEADNQKNLDRSLERESDFTDPQHGSINGAQVKKALSEKVVERQDPDRSNLNTDFVSASEGLHIALQDGSEQASPTTAVSDSAIENSNGGYNTKESTFKCDLGKSDTDNKDQSTAPEISGRGERPDSSDQLHCSGRSLTASGLDDESKFDSLTSSTRSFVIQRGIGELTSGHVPYSGSVSLRSDSSSASTHSFAFPTLHSEWGSSPVKMAKADRTHFPKHRGWRVAFCCRF